MAKYKIFVDGSAGTTGLRIADRLAARPEFEILTISEADRKDVHARAAVINGSDLSFLCLPDDAAREVVPLLRPDVRVRNRILSFTDCYEFLAFSTIAYGYYAAYLVS